MDHNDILRIVSRDDTDKRSIGQSDSIIISGYLRIFQFLILVDNIEQRRPEGLTGLRPENLFQDFFWILMIRICLLIVDSFDDCRLDIISSIEQRTISGG